MIGLHLDSCDTHQRSETTEEKDKKGNKTTKTSYWVSATCTAALRIVDAATGRELVSADVSGDGESIKAKSRYSYMTDEALKDAVDSVALKALDTFVARRDRQTLVLEKSAPSFREANGFIKDKRYADARKTWEAALASNKGSAALHLDLAEIDEVAGDRPRRKNTTKRRRGWTGRRITRKRYKSFSSASHRTSH